MAKQINNFKKAWRDRIECEFFFSKTQLVKELLNFDFWISCHSVTIFRNISTFQDAISLKANEHCQKFFHINFVSITSSSFKIIYLFCYNLKSKFCCQSRDIIFPSKAVKIEKQKAKDFLEYRVLPSCKVWAQRNKKCKSSSSVAGFWVLWAQRVKCQRANTCTYNVFQISYGGPLTCIFFLNLTYDHCNEHSTLQFYSIISLFFR